MPLSTQYEGYLRERLEYFERKGRESYARQGAITLLRMVLYDALLGEPLQGWIPLFEELLLSAGPDHSELVLPDFHLMVACSAWLLERDGEDSLVRGWSCVERAWAVAVSEEERTMVSSAALALAVAREDHVGTESWLGVRRALPPAHALADVELMYVADTLVTRSTGPYASADLVATIACQELLYGYGGRPAYLTALARSSRHHDDPLSAILAKGRQLVDGDLWPDGYERDPRADYRSIEWTIENDNNPAPTIRGYLRLMGQGGKIAAPAPLLTPMISSLVELVEKNLRQKAITNGVEFTGDEPRFEDLIARPDVPLEIVVELEKEIMLEPDCLRLYKTRLQTAVRWMQARHIGFRGPVDLRS